MRQYKAILEKTIHDNTRQHNTIPSEARQDETRQPNIIQCKPI